MIAHPQATTILKSTATLGPHDSNAPMVLGRWVNFR